MGPQTVRCKFKCIATNQSEGWGDNKVLHGASFSVVTNGSDENKQFFAATPSGSFSVATAKQGHFEVGKEYFIDIIEA